MNFKLFTRESLDLVSFDFQIAINEIWQTNRSSVLEGIKREFQVFSMCLNVYNRRQDRIGACRIYSDLYVHANISRSDQEQIYQDEIFLNQLRQCLASFLIDQIKVDRFKVKKAIEDIKYAEPLKYKFNGLIFFKAYKLTELLRSLYHEK